MRAKLKVAALALLAGAALPVLAQESILPPGFGDPPPPPAQQAPAQPQPQQPSPTAPAPVTPRIERVGDTGETGELLVTEGADSLAEAPAVQPEYVAAARRGADEAGLFAPQSLGLGDNAWGGAHGKFLQVLMRRMDTPLASRWAHIVLRSALLAKGPTPAGVHPSDFAAERAWLLLRMGEADAGRMLVSTVDTDRFTPKMVQIASQAALATSDPSGLCPIEAPLQKVEPKVGPLVSAMCAALSGAPEQAASLVERTRNRGRLPPIDVSLADKVIGAAADSSRAVTIEWEPVQRLDNWRYGLASATGMLPPERLLDAAPLQLQAWFARSPIFPPEQRLAAARTAARLGVFSSTGYVSLMAAAYDRTDPDTLGQTDPWQLRLAYAGEDLDTKMEAMRKLWGTGDEDDRYGSLVLTARAATLVAPDASLSSDAPNLIAAMLAGGYDRHAARWASVLGDLEDADADRAWAMLALGAPSVNGLDVSAGRIEDFADRDDSEKKHRTALLVAGLLGLGRIDADTANALGRKYELRLSGNSRWSGFIDGAAERGQAGTVALLAASGMQAASPEALSGRYLLHSVAGLRRVGLEFAARMVAAEALARS